MKRFVLPSLITILLTLLALTTIWHTLPGLTAKALLAANSVSAGLKAKKIETSIGMIHYLEGGEGETVLLLHGIYARKEHWVGVAKDMVDEYHIIALDIPGFGDNAVLDVEDYNLSKQSKNLALVIDALGLEDFHIGANSMGAYIAAQYIDDNPERPKSLSLIGSPLGVLSPIKSDMEIAMKGSALPLIASTNKEFVARSEWLSPNELYIPSPVLKTWMKAEVSQADLNRLIWDSVHDDLMPLTDINGIKNYTGLTLILWCEEDRIFHVSGAKVLSQALKRPHVEILQGCGHVPMLDEPKLIAEKYKNFLGAQDF